MVRLENGERANCIRCSKTLVRQSRFGPNAWIAFALAGCALMIPALLLPQASLEVLGSKRFTYIGSESSSLWANNMEPLSGWVYFCILIAPVALLCILCMQAVAGNSFSKGSLRLTSASRWLALWSMPEVHLLAMLIALVKVGDYMSIAFQPGIWAFGGASIAILLSWRLFDHSEKSRKEPQSRTLEELASHKRHSITNASAFSLAAVFLLIPANSMPIMTTKMAGSPVSEVTIVSGISALFEGGLWGLALIVFTASILVPILKLAGLGWLIYLAANPNQRFAVRGTKLYSFLERIGRWSMLDVFLVAFLVGATQFEQLATIEPRGGIVAFAGVVILTMIATHNFDPKLIWESNNRTPNQND